MFSISVPSIQNMSNIQFSKKFIVIHVTINESDVALKFVRYVFYFRIYKNNFNEKTTKNFKFYSEKLNSRF